MTATASLSSFRALSKGGKASLPGPRRAPAVRLFASCSFGTEVYGRVSYHSLASCCFLSSWTSGSVCSLFSRSARYAMVEGCSGSGGGGAMRGVRYVANCGGYREPIAYALQATEVVNAAVRKVFDQFEDLAAESEAVDASLRCVDLSVAVMCRLHALVNICQNVSTSWGRRMKVGSAPYLTGISSNDRNPERIHVVLFVAVRIESRRLPDLEGPRHRLLPLLPLSPVPLFLSLHYSNPFGSKIGPKNIFLRNL